MTTTTPPTSVRFDLRSIPGLMPPSMVTPLDDLSPGGLPQVGFPRSFFPRGIRPCT